MKDDPTSPVEELMNLLEVANPSRNSIEISTDTKGKAKFTIKLYFENNTDARENAQTEIVRFTEWFYGVRNRIEGLKG